MIESYSPRSRNKEMEEEEHIQKDYESEEFQAVALAPILERGQSSNQSDTSEMRKEVEELIVSVAAPVRAKEKNTMIGKPGKLRKEVEEQKLSVPKVIPSSAKEMTTLTVLHSEEIKEKEKQQESKAWTNIVKNRKKAPGSELKYIPLLVKDGRRIGICSAAFRYGELGV